MRLTEAVHMNLYIISKSNAVQFDWWWSAGRHIHVMPGSAVYMSCGNGFRLVWLHKGDSVLEPIKDRW